MAEGEWQSSIFAAKNTYVHNVTVDGCTFTGTDAKQAYGIRLHHAYDITVKNTTGTKLYDLVYGNTAVTGFTAENVTVTDSGMGFMMPYGMNLSFKNVNLTTEGAGVGIYNYNASTATFDSCTFASAPAIWFGEKNTTNNYTLIFKGTNNFGTENWLTLDGQGAELTVDLTDSNLDIAKVTYDKSYYAVDTAEKVHTFRKGVFVAKIGEQHYESLAAAIAAVKDGETIVLLADNDEDVTIKQTKDLSFTIDGADKIMTGTIQVNGNRRSTGAETLTIQKVNFVADTASQIFVEAVSGTYAHNITVDNCTFTGDEAKTAYGLKIPNSYNITVKNSTGTKLLDLAYSNKVVTGFTAENVTVTDSVNGFYMSYMKNGSFAGLNLDVSNIGVYTNNYNASSMTIADSTIKAANPVVLQQKNTGNKYNVTISGTNSFTGTSATGEWLTVEGADASFKVTVNDAALDMTKTSGLVAKIGENGNVYYNRVNGAIADAVDGDTIYVIADAEEATTFDKNIVLEVGENKLLGKITVAEGAELTIMSGTFDDMEAKQYVHEKMYGKDNGDGTWTVVDYVLWIKEQLLAGNDVTLEKDIVIDGSYIESIPAPTNGNGKYPNYGIFNVVGDEVTFDLNGHTITYNGHESFEWNGKTVNSCTVAHGVFFANAGADLTIVDTSADKSGTVMVYGLASGAYVASNDTSITIKGGTWKNEGCKTCGGTNIFMYPLQGGELYIEDGHFEQALDSNGDSYLLVVHGGEYKNSVIDYSKTKLVVSGGTFVGMNPEEAHYFQQTADNKLVTGETTDVVAEGYYATSVGENTWGIEAAVAIRLDAEGYYIKGYGDVTDALDAAKSGETVKMLKDYTEILVTVSSGVTLDLNGCYLTASNFLSFGNVVDNGDTTGGLKISNDTSKAFTLLQSNNTEMPLYDTADGCYRFYQYSLSVLSVKEGTNKVTFRTRLRLGELKAYELLEDTANSGVEMYYTVTWTGLDTSLQYKIPAELLAAHAKAAYDQVASGAKEPMKHTQVITMTITGLDALDAGDQVQANPTVASKTGVSGTYAKVNEYSLYTIS